MFALALALGIFSYAIFFFGLLGLLYPMLLIIFSVLFWGAFIFYERKSVLIFIRNFSLRDKSLFFKLGLFYLLIQALVNVVGLFGPEIGFDATWYHLTLPKLYLMYHAVVHIPGGILYYSDMPKLTEMLYIVGLSFGSDFFARGIHLLLGIATVLVLYKLGRRFFSPAWSLVLPVIFYSSLVVGWESVSAYIDLSRTFFATTALLAFFQWTEKNEQKYFFYSAVFVGLTISTKLLALPDLFIYSVALLLYERKTLSLLQRVQRVLAFLGIALVGVLPWLTFAYVHTGNPVYPMLSSAYRVPGYWQILNPLFLLRSIWETFATSTDPIHPIFLALLPFFLLFGKKLWKDFFFPSLFALGGLIAWYITPQTGGGRYILPYLSMLSVVSVFVILHLSKKWQGIFILLIILVAMISLVYRGVANVKYFPVISHKETRSQFMQKYLQFNLGDFYDIDGYFAKHIKPTDRVLLYGFHNLYYVDFPFIDSSWVAKGNTFNYVAVQGNGMPDRFKYWTLIYFNPITQVRLYTLKGQTWFY